MYLRLTWRGELLHSLSLRFVDAFGASSDTQRSDPCSMWPFLVRLQSWLPPAPWQDGALMEPRWILDGPQLLWIVFFDKDLYLTWAFTTIVVALRLRTASKVKESSVLRPRIDIILYAEIDTLWTSKPKNIWNLWFKSQNYCTHYVVGIL